MGQNQVSVYIEKCRRVSDKERGGGGGVSDKERGGEGGRRGWGVWQHWSETWALSLVSLDPRPHISTPSPLVTGSTHLQGLVQTMTSFSSVMMSSSLKLKIYADNPRICNNIPFQLCTKCAVVFRCEFLHTLWVYTSVMAETHFFTIVAVTGIPSPSP